MENVLASLSREKTPTPLDYLLEQLVRLLVSLVIPFSVSSELLSQWKGVALSFLLQAVLIFALIILFSLKLLTQFASPVSTQTNLTADPTFTATDIPSQNPLGGQGLSLVIITAGFMDPHYTFFSGIHTGVDFVPTTSYYQTNKTYQQTGDVIVYATVNGTVTYYIDTFGSRTVEIMNTSHTLKTIDMHLNKVFVRSGQTVSAGTPVGTMGDTGFTTGEHLHYEIRILINGFFVPVNPLAYIR